MVLYGRQQGIDEGIEMNIGIYKYHSKSLHFIPYFRHT